MLNFLDLFNLYEVSHYFNALVKRFQSILSEEDKFRLYELKRFICGKVKIDTSYFEKVCEWGCTDIVKLLADREECAIDWNAGLYDACKGGHMEIVRFLIEKGANNWDYGFNGACYGGKLEMLKLMIEKGAEDFTHGLAHACRGGNVEIVKFIISIKKSIQDAGGWYHACYYGFIEIVKLLITYNKPKGVTYWNWGLTSAARNGEIAVGQLMIENGAINLNEALFESCYHGHLKMSEFLISKGANECDNCNMACH